MSFKEQRDLEGIEAAIHATEAKVAGMEAELASPDFHRMAGPKIRETMAAIEAGKKDVARLYARWEELEAIRAAS